MAEVMHRKDRVPPRRARLLPTYSTPTQLHLLILSTAVCTSVMQDWRLQTLSPSLASAGFPKEASQHTPVPSYLYLPNSLVSILLPISLDVWSVCLCVACPVLFLKKFSLCVCVCQSVCLYTTWVWKPAESGEAADLLELELQTVVSHRMCAVPESSAKSVSATNHSSISLVPYHFFPLKLLS